MSAAAESRDEVVICTTNKKYVTNNPSSYKTTTSVSVILPSKTLTNFSRQWLAY